MTTHGLITWRLLGIQQALDEPDSQLRQRACRQLGVEGGELRGFRIARRSLDARKGRHTLHFNCHVDLVLPAGRKPALLVRAERSGQVRLAPERGSLVVSAHTDGDC